MQNMWISVALIVAVIIVGIIAGKRLSTPGPQRRAVYFAFGTLAVLALWFFIFVAFFPAEWIVPFFTVACIIIPICVYMMVLRSGGKERAKVPSKRSFEIPKKDITVESAKAASTVSSGTASASSATTPSKAAAPATTSPSEDQLREAAEIEILVDRAAEEEAAKIEELVRPFASQATPTMNAEKERELNVGAPVSSSKEKTPTNKEVTPAKASTAPTPTPAPTPESTPKPAAKPAPKPAKKAPVDHFAEFSARATALRDQGAYAIAAMLFEEAAALAPNANEARNSHFEELACYVKAGDAAKAKEIAAKLRQSSVLTRFERIKLDAVERMS